MSYYAVIDTSFLKGGPSHMGLDIFKELSTKYLNTISLLLIPIRLSKK